MNSKIFCEKNRTHSVHVSTLHQTKIWMWASNVHICNIAFTHTFRILFLCRPQTHPPPLYRSSVYSFTLVPMKTVTILAGCSATCRCQSIVQCAWAFEESPLESLGQDSHPHRLISAHSPSGLTLNYDSNQTLGFVQSFDGIPLRISDTVQYFFSKSAILLRSILNLFINFCIRLSIVFAVVAAVVSNIVIVARELINSTLDFFFVTRKVTIEKNFNLLSNIPCICITHLVVLWLFVVLF